MKTYNTELWEQYSLEQHAQIIDLSFGFLQKEKVADEIKTLFEESGIESYVLWKEQLWSKIISWRSERNDQQQFSSLCIEMQKLLQHFLYQKKPLAYKHIAYDDFKIWTNQKFVVFMDYTGAVGADEVVLLTWTGKKQHRDHLTAFLQAHDTWMMHVPSLVWLDHLWWWWVERSEKNIRVHSPSLWLWATSQVTRKVIFETLFSDEHIVIDS